MKENDTALYPNPEVSQAVTQYSLEHSTKLPQYILDYHAWGSTQPKANFIISPFQAQFQIFMARAMGAKRILEIGTYIGFSTMGWSEAVGPEGHVTGLEFSPEYAEIARETFSKNNLSNVEVLVGDARESIKSLIANLQEPYDLIFIDADKTSYPAYLDLILSLSSPSSTQTRLLKPSGLILADNILRRALVADSSAANPWALKNGEKTWKEGDLNALKEFNDLMVTDKRLDTFLLPLFDGVGMGRLKD
ncbi:hypothetical protein BPOR_0098g00180 [Botrytis porri]|uniref:O-methyltransferase domain-containing protein n=1 Tax=Botrytis porri TaxID=87229 RepID=A0A4Z1KYT4_9HELO|nr:hypothetical protein BPOR_0098g00180 [Botrytis porri]